MRYLIILFAAYFLISCKKEREAPFETYLRMTIDGTRAVVAHINIKASPSTTSLLTIRGAWNTGSLEISLFSFNNMAGETMVNSTIINSNIISPRFSLADYHTLPGATYYAGDRGYATPAAGSGKLTIILVNDEFIKGTFEFVTAVNIFSGEKRTVTNGEFHIKRGY